MRYQQTRGTKSVQKDLAREGWDPPTQEIQFE